MQTRHVWAVAAALGGCGLAWTGCGESNAGEDKGAVAVKAEVPHGMSENEMAQVAQRLQGKWSLSIDEMLPQELVIEGDRATYSILPGPFDFSFQGEVRKGTLVVVSPTEFRVRSEDREDPFWFWWDPNGDLHVQVLNYYKPMHVSDRERFVIDYVGDQITFEAGVCMFTNSEVTAPKKVDCGFGKEGTIPGVNPVGGVTEFFYYAIPGRDAVTDPKLRNNILYFDGKLLVPPNLALATAKKGS